MLLLFVLASESQPDAQIYQESQTIGPIVRPSPWNEHVLPVETENRIIKFASP